MGDVQQTLLVVVSEAFVSGSLCTAGLSVHSGKHRTLEVSVDIEKEWRVAGSTLCSLLNSEKKKSYLNNFCIS